MQFKETFLVYIRKADGSKVWIVFKPLLVKSYPRYSKFNLLRSYSELYIHFTKLKYLSVDRVHLFRAANLARRKEIPLLRMMSGKESLDIVNNLNNSSSALLRSADLASQPVIASKIKISSLDFECTLTLWIIHLWFYLTF